MFICQVKLSAYNIILHYFQHDMLDSLNDVLITITVIIQH